MLFLILKRICNRRKKEKKKILQWILNSVLENQVFERIAKLTEMKDIVTLVKA